MRRDWRHEQLVEAILTAASLHRWNALRYDTGSVPTKTGRRNFGTRGVWDVMMWRQLPMQGVELVWADAKTGRGKLTIDQELFAQKHHSKFVSFYVVSDKVDDFLQWLQGKDRQ